MSHLNRFLAAVSLLLFITGCTVNSDNPLLDTTKATHPFPDRTVAVATAEGYMLQSAGSGYDFVDDKKFKSVHFIPTPEIGTDTLVAQVVLKSGGYTYGLLMKTNSRFYRLGISEDWIREAGVTYESAADGGVKVSSRQALIAALRTSYDHVAAKDRIAFDIYDLDNPAQARALQQRIAKAKQQEQARQQKKQAEANKPRVTEAGKWFYREEKDPIDDTLRQYLFGVPAEANGTLDKPYLRIGCYDKKMGVTLYWGTPVSQLYSDGTGDLAGVDVRFDQQKALYLAWAASADRTTTYALNSMAAAANQLGSDILNSILPGFARPVNATWTAKELHRMLLTSDKVVMRTNTRGAGPATLIFDMNGYKDVARNFRSSCQ